MAIVNGEKLRVTLERTDGQVLAGTVIATTLNVYTPSMRYIGGDDSIRYAPLNLEWDLELTGVGQPEFTMRDEFVEQVNKRHSAIEWLCDFCECVNPKENRRCDSCNAPRGFVYSE